MSSRPSSGTSPRVLIVDDETNVLLIIRASLQDQGYEVETAETANEALALLAKGRWDVAVVDVVLPGQSGLELLHKIRASAPDVQVIMLTGFPTVETAAESTRSGASDYLVKPVMANAIRRTVAHAAKVKRLIDGRRQVEEELRTAKETAEAANRAKTRFLSNVNHELRTPLTAIIGFSELLQEKIAGELTPKQETYVNDIAESGRLLLSLVNDLLDLTKVDADRMELFLTEFPIAPLIEHSLAMVQATCQARAIQTQLEIPKEMRATLVTADERRLKQVLFNLLSNAAKFTPDGGIITLRAQILGDSILISVSDTGIGIARELQPMLFTPFHQIPNAITAHTPGSGLGLALVRRLVELHGGQVWVESEGEGKGSTFQFTLPLQTAPHQRPTDVLRTSPGVCILDAGSGGQ